MLSTAISEMANKISLPGYLEDIDYNTQFNDLENYPYCAQYTFMVSNREISFYNERYIDEKNPCLVAVWKVKSPNN